MQTDKAQQVNIHHRKRGQILYFKVPHDKCTVKCRNQASPPSLIRARCKTSSVNCMSIEEMTCEANSVRENSSFILVCCVNNICCFILSFLKSLPR